MNNEQLKVSLIQSDLIWEDYKANLLKFSDKIKKIQSTDLIILPEMFTSGFSMNPMPIAQSMNGPAVEWLRKTAQQKRAAVIGSIVIKENQRYFNRLLCAMPDNRLFKYDKKHLFSFAGENEQYSSGSDNLIIDLKQWRIATYICYDLRFPIWSRNNYSKYDVAIYVANWPKKRANHWKTLLQARAIENQCYVIGLNRVGVDGNGIEYSGDSTIVNPSGEVLFCRQGIEVCYTHTLSISEIIVTRKTFPFLKDADNFKLLKESVIKNGEGNRI